MARGRGSGVIKLNESQAEQCAETLRNQWCVPQPAEWLEAQRYAVTPSDAETRAESVTAEFLLTRGDFAWIGYGFINCSGTDWVRPKEWDADYGGIALSPCSETSLGSGVFRRQYPNAVAEWNCHTAEGSISSSGRATDFEHGEPQA